MENDAFESNTWVWREVPGLLEACHAVADLGPREATFPLPGTNREGGVNVGKRGDGGETGRRQGKETLVRM